MSSNDSLGPVQVFSNDAVEINQGFRELSERLDALKGLRGRAEIFDRTRVDDPTENQDALTLGALDESNTGVAILQGRPGGQNLRGGTLASENLTLGSTADATKGVVRINDASTFQWIDSNSQVLHSFGG